MNYKRIGIDFHKVINADVQFFTQFCRAAVNEDYEIHVISGGPKTYIRQYLIQQQIPYFRLWCIYDYYKDKEKIIYRDDGSFFLDDEIWNSAKAKYCRLHKIAVHIDDSLIYGKYFSTPYCLYNPHTKNGSINRHNISFSGNAAEVLHKLSVLIKN